MPVSLRVAWQKGVCTSRNNGDVIVAGCGSRLALRHVAPEIAENLDRLSSPGEDENRLAERLLTAGHGRLLPRWHYFFEQFHRRGFLSRSLYSGDRLLATAVPLGRAQALAPAPIGPAKSYVLSRFAYLRREDGNLAIECPTAHHRIVLHDPAAVAAIGLLAAPATIGSLAERLDGLSFDAASKFVELLAEVGMLQEAGADALPDDQADSPFAAWEFHDLLFHARSRRGRSDAAFGGTYRLASQPPPPAVNESPAGEVFDLYRPDLNQLRRNDPPLAEVQERRRSVRSYALQPIAVRQLGEFLFRVARVKDCWQGHADAPSGRIPMEFAARPYPAGGALYELEFYLAVKACQGLDPGLYHYQAMRHQLARLRGPTAVVERLLAEAGRSAGIAPESLQVLVVLAARIARIAWKYESIAYALVLKHVGVVYQTMYLAATAMGLAPCAIGCGDADLFSTASGIDYYTEASVGEFLLGNSASGLV